MNTSERHVFLVVASLIALLLICSTPALAVGVDVTRVSNTQITVKISVSSAESIKDFHFDKGVLPNNPANSPTVTDEDGLGWNVSVAGGKVNVFGALSVASPDTTFTITLPAGVRWGQNSANAIILTSDGDADAQTGYVSTATGKIPTILAVTDIPTVSEWGLIIMTLLLLIAGTVILRRRQIATKAIV